MYRSNFAPLIKVNQWYFSLETKTLRYIVENRKENNNEFFIKIDLSFLVDRIKIYRTVILNYGSCLADGARPVYLVVAGVDIFQDKSKERTIILANLISDKITSSQVLVFFFAPCPSPSNCSRRIMPLCSWVLLYTTIAR